MLANRLIPLDKGNGCEVRQIGVGEVIRRIIGTSTTKVTKQDIITTSVRRPDNWGRGSHSRHAQHI